MYIVNEADNEMEYKSVKICNFAPRDNTSIT